MKSRLLIIIGIIIAIGIVTTILTIDFLENKETTVYDTSIEQLEVIMEYCIDSEVLVETVGLSYYNNTHFIDTIACEWQRHDGVEIDSEGLDSRWIAGEDYCSEWCDQDELRSIGCNQPILAHLTKNTNLLSDTFDGVYYRNFVGLPDGVSNEKFQECADFILEKRTSISYGFSGTQNVKNPEHCSGGELCVSGKMDKVIDGDTIRVDGGNFLLSTSFALSFVPELDEEGGKAAKKFIEVLCPIGSEVLIDQDGLYPFDRSHGLHGGMIISEVHCNGVNLNEKLAASQYGDIDVGFCKNSEFGDSDWAKDNGCSE